MLVENKIRIETSNKVAYKAFFIALILIFSLTYLSLNVYAQVENNEEENNLLVYEDMDKSLRITEISFSEDFTSMSVLVKNMENGSLFRTDYDINQDDTVNEYIEITATDNMGNESETVKIRNPFWVENINEEELSGSLSVVGSSIGTPTNEIRNGFNTRGWAEVVDYAISDSKEFFIIRSEIGNEFYLVIDRENNRENVYFLNAVTEWDLMGLTERHQIPNNLNPNLTSGNMGVGGQWQSNGNNQSIDETENNIDSQNTQEESQQKGRSYTVVIIVCFGLLGFAGFWYFTKMRGNKNIEDNSDSDGFSEYEEEENEDSDEHDDEDNEDSEEYDEEEDNEDSEENVESVESHSDVLENTTSQSSGDEDANIDSSSSVVDSSHEEGKNNNESNDYIVEEDNYSEDIAERDNFSEYEGDDIDEEEIQKELECYEDDNDKV